MKKIAKGAVVVFDTDGGPSVRVDTINSPQEFLVRDLFPDHEGPGGVYFALDREFGVVEMPEATTEDFLRELPRTVMDLLVRIRELETKLKEIREFVQATAI